MSNEEFETWLSLVGRLLQLSDAQRNQISEELRDHLESRVVELVESGLDERSAALQAVEEFGDAAVLAKNLQSVSLANRKRWVMRFTVLASAGLFVVVLLTMAMWPQNARFGSPSRSVAQTVDESQPVAINDSRRSATSLLNTRIREQLQQDVVFEFREAPFGVVTDFIKGELNCNVVIDENLEGDLDLKSMVNCQLSDVRWSDALRIMLRSNEATYVVDNGVIRVISLADANTMDYHVRRMIDVSDLLKTITEREKHRIGKPYLQGGGGLGGGGLGGGGNGGGGVFSYAAQLGPQATNNNAQPVPLMVPVNVLTAESLLTECITQVIHPATWVDYGGEGELACIGGVLIVCSSELIANDTEDFLVDLEFQLKKQAK